MRVPQWHNGPGYGQLVQRTFLTDNQPVHDSDFIPDTIDTRFKNGHSNMAISFREER